MKNLILVLLITYTSFSFSQSNSKLDDILKESPKIPLSNIQSIVKMISNYDVVMLGELHGSVEPYFYLNLIINEYAKEKPLILALELPYYLNDSILNEKFSFKNDSFFIQQKDARASCNLIDFIENTRKNKNIEIFFFEPYYTRYEISNSDSMMFINLNNKIKETSEKIIFTLSGNYHNKLEPTKHSKPMGAYLYSDSLSNVKPSRILSINHTFEKGSFYRKTENGMLIQNIENKNNAFAKYSNIENYLVIFPEIFGGYNAYLYTEKITPCDYNCK